VPLFGLGIGNDFGHQNETYLSVSQGYRPLRFYDVASPFSNLRTVSIADPSRSLSWEAGVHGTPVRGLFYDADLFWIDFKNRIESVSCAAGAYYNPACAPNDMVDVNTGDTRHRGLEAELSYDFLEARGATRQHLILFGNVSLLDARFTASTLLNQVGRIPAFAPHYLFKAGLTWREEGRYKLSLTGVSVGSQYWQDSDLAAVTACPPATNPCTLIPAKIPSYTVLDFAGDVNLTRRWRLLFGVSNLTDKKYYSRVFQNGIEPAPGRTIYGGLALGF
jgi:Fe(3+) dicitrate transport protein